MMLTFRHHERGAPGLKGLNDIVDRSHSIPIPQLLLDYPTWIVDAQLSAVMGNPDRVCPGSF
jgi:hypothetical protein